MTAVVELWEANEDANFVSGMCIHAKILESVAIGDGGQRLKGPREGLKDLVLVCCVCLFSTMVEAFAFVVGRGSDGGNRRGADWRGKSRGKSSRVETADGDVEAKGTVRRRELTAEEAEQWMMLLVVDVMANPRRTRCMGCPSAMEHAHIYLLLLLLL